MRTASLVLLSLMLSSCIVNIETGENDRDDRRSRKTIYGNGDDGYERRTLRGFDAVSFATEGELYVTFGDEEAIEIEADENLLRYFVTYVRNNTLYIGVENGVELRPDRPIHFYLTVRSIDALALTSGGDAEIASMDADEFDLAISGSGDARLTNVQARSLNLSVAGSGDVRVDGVVDDLDVSIAGSGNVRGASLEAQRASVSIAASGSVDVRVVQKLNVSIAGSGSVRYYGNPSVSATTVGAGRVVHAGD